MRKYHFFLLILLGSIIISLFATYFIVSNENIPKRSPTEFYRYKKLVYSLIPYTGFGLVFLERDNPFRPISNESNIAAIMIGRNGKIIIDVLNISSNYAYINFTVMFKHFETKKLLLSSAILKIDTKTYHVYDVKDNFIGKWIYTLSSDVPVEELELKKHIRNCTLVLANYHGKKFYGPCIRVLREDKEMILIGPNIEKRIVLDESRNIILDGVPHCYYNPKSKLLVRVEDAILDDILYNVFGIYYVDNAYLALTEIEEAG